MHKVLTADQSGTLVFRRLRVKMILSITGTLAVLLAVLLVFFNFIIRREEVRQTDTIIGDLFRGNGHRSLPPKPRIFGDGNVPGNAGEHPGDMPDVPRQTLRGRLIFVFLPRVLILTSLSIFVSNLTGSERARKR